MRDLIMLYLVLIGKLERVKKIIDMEDLYEELGYSYIYHYNGYTKEHNCIHREDYKYYFNGFKDKCDIGWTSGKTVEEAQKKMLKRIK